ncbi:MAG: COQ9 family protein [Asticcacaulis sp.]
MSAHIPFSSLKAAEIRLALAVADFVPELGLNALSLKAGARILGMSDGESELIAPNGATDIAAILWRAHDAALPESAESLSDMKIRQKIAHLLNLRLDAAAEHEKLAMRLMGFFALPRHAALYHRLLWQTADTIWRLAGDKALDENHYSKRLIVSGILTTAMMTRLSQGRDAQLAQIDRNIEKVMQYEKFKAKLPASPESLMLGLAEKLGRLRFGSSAA